MGNCCRRESSMVWASVEDEWNQSVTLKKEKESLLSDHDHNREEVKIKITKRQLQEFLGRVDMEDLTTEQALCQLVNAGDGNLSDVQSRRPWRLRLHSIPEVD
ncbi:uncharacterized protein LOC111395203 [Olea europaea var. sylvestris]|uniref:uncharacterized protein LOC111395203 n=1 Tax=Olea europaea var. sylvestris TaxID=158386 RepID=UPI000C1D6651|nr:uncharacterized protein LOC111395203 [Olea europaea var. sylvestris]